MSIPITLSLASSMLPVRRDDGDKRSFGRLLCICGSRDMPGAAVMSCLSALRSGAGLVTLASVSSVIDTAARLTPEATFLRLKGEISPVMDSIESLLSVKEDAMLLGCGIGLEPDTQELVRALIMEGSSPLVLDADGINSLRGSSELLKATKRPIIITPHHREMARLMGISPEEVTTFPEACAAAAARDLGVTVVLKGHITHIAAPDGRSFILDRPNSGLSKGGSGDVLAGCIASLLAQGASPAEAAACGAFIHSEAAAMAAEEFGKRSMLARDVIDMLPRAFMKAEDFSRPGVSANI